MSLKIKSDTMRLNLGCGSDLRPDYINVDKFPADPSVVQANFPILPFGDASASEVLLSHVLEHFGFAEARTLCNEIYRVLTPGGRATIEVPDIEWCMQQFLQAPELDSYTDPCFDYSTTHRWGLFAQSIWGDQHNDGLFHKWGYTRTRLSALLSSVGFASVKIDVVFSHGVQCLSALATK